MLSAVPAMKKIGVCGICRTAANAYTSCGSMPERIGVTQVISWFRGEAGRWVQVSAWLKMKR